MSDGARSGGGSGLSLDLVARLERSEMAAEGDFFRSPPSESVVACGAGVSWIEGSVALQASRVDVLSFNRIVGIGLHTPATPATIDTVLARYERQGVPRFFVQVSPAARPGKITEWLTNRGFEHYNNWLRMYRSIGPDDLKAPPSTIRIEETGTNRGTLFGTLLVGSFEWPASVIPWLAASVGRPGWRHYLAFIDDLPAGTAAMHVSDGTGWLDFASTDPRFRGRGVQPALIARRLADAAALSCSEVHMETAEPRLNHPAPAFRNAEEAGFRLLYQRPNYIHRQPDQTTGHRA